MTLQWKNLFNVTLSMWPPGDYTSSYGDSTLNNNTTSTEDDLDVDFYRDKLRELRAKCGLDNNNAAEVSVVSRGLTSDHCPMPIGCVDIARIRQIKDVSSSWGKLYIFPGKNNMSFCFFGFAISSLFRLYKNKGVLYIWLLTALKRMHHFFSSLHVLYQYLGNMCIFKLKEWYYY